MEKFVDDIQSILEQARKKAYASASFAMIEGYWLIGKRIVEEEQLGMERAQYGKKILRKLSEELGKGFSERTLRDIRKCYLTFPDWQHLAEIASHSAERETVRHYLTGARFCVSTDSIKTSPLTALMN